ncbi:hypothetical protein N658DRAFT_91187 [Parathielavia hyrcaniae]|uniref:Uncharacterized protein n=1 Tax=Parathielavia hyrcaniae TaxID=113614 RepID=A0AAN6PZB8_9PEZI|nr:hypothetical protein N658DRAFT_91187 [Parathielavia hyrcaniae]
MANNSSASAFGTARPAGSVYNSRSIPSTAKAFQLFLRHRRRALRDSASSSEDSNTASFGKSLANPVSPLTSKNGILTSLPLRVKLSDSTSTLPLRSHLTSPVAVSKLAKLYRRSRNIQRAVSLFLLRRQLWRRSRRPTSRMDFIEQLRLIQSDEPSSDEESGLILTSATARRTRRPTLSLRDHPTPPSELPGQGKKRKRDPVPVDAPAQKPSLAAKKAKTQIPSPAASSHGPCNTSSKSAKFPTLDAEPTGGATSPKRRAPDSNKPPARPDFGSQQRPGLPTPAGTLSSSSTTSPSIPVPVPARARSSKPPPPSSPLSPSPSYPPSTTSSSSNGPNGTTTTIPKNRELFERRVYEMLTDPLGFDDCVRDSARPTPRHVVREFARYRSRQTQPPPPLVMSGALGPMPVPPPSEGAKVMVGAKVKVNGGSGAGGSAGAGGGSKGRSKILSGLAAANGSGGGSLLAREVQKRAHRQMVEDPVEGFRGEEKGKGKGKGRELEERDERGDIRELVNGSKQAEGGLGKTGKAKERAWLTNARQKATNNTGNDGGGAQKGGQHSMAKKYTKA